MTNGTDNRGPLAKLEKGVLDLAELEVLTFTGELTAVVNDQDAINWEELLKKAKTEGEVALVAATLIKIDGDTLLFFASEASAHYEALKQSHLEATRAAQQYRQGLVEAFADLLGIK
jgi:hypothetical protein